MNLNEHFIDEANLPNSLPNDEQILLVKKAQCGDKDAEEKLILHNIRLVRYEVMHKFLAVDYDQKELLSVGIMGLMKAINHFNLEKNVKFSTFASTCIDNEILIFLKKNKKWDCIFSMENIIVDNKRGTSVKIKDTLQDDINIIEDYEDKILKKRLRELVEYLPKPKRDVVALSCGFYNSRVYNQTEIAKMLGISQSYVSRVFKESVKIIKEFLQTEGLIEVEDESIIPLKKRTIKNLYESFGEYDRDEINLAIESLEESEKALVIFKYGENFEHPILFKSGSKESKEYQRIFKKIKRRLKSNRKKIQKDGQLLILAKK